MFKKALFSVGFLLLIFSANAQFRKIPAEVTDAFKAKYADASGVTWRDKLSSFQADYKVGDKEMKSLFSSTGEWLKTETKSSVENLPADVKDGFHKSKYAKWNVQDVLKTEEKDKGVLYKVTVKKSDFNKKYLVFASTGQLISDSGSL